MMNAASMSSAARYSLALDQLSRLRLLFWPDLEHCRRLLLYRDARLRRLTRYRYNNAPLDMGGRYIYLREDAPHAAAPRAWLPTWMPMRARWTSTNAAMAWATPSSARGSMASKPRRVISSRQEKLSKSGN